MRFWNYASRLSHAIRRLKIWIEQQAKIVLMRQWECVRVMSCRLWRILPSKFLQQCSAANDCLIIDFFLLNSRNRRPAPQANLFWQWIVSGVFILTTSSVIVFLIFCLRDAHQLRSTMLCSIAQLPELMLLINLFYCRIWKIDERRNDLLTFPIALKLSFPPTDCFPFP